MWKLLPFCFALAGCFRRTLPEIPNAFPKNIGLDDVYMQWPMYMTWLGGALVFAGVLWLMWGSRKDSGIRLIGTGMVLAATAKIMIWAGEHFWWLVGGVTIVYCVFNPRWTERILAKFRIFIDLDGDNKIGTGRYAFKKPRHWFGWFKWSRPRP